MHDDFPDEQLSLKSVAALCEFQLSKLSKFQIDFQLDAETIAALLCSLAARSHINAFVPLTLERTLSKLFLGQTRQPAFSLWARSVLNGVPVWEFGATPIAEPPESDDEDDDEEEEGRKTTRGLNKRQTSCLNRVVVDIAPLFLQSADTFRSCSLHPH